MSRQTLTTWVAGACLIGPLVHYLAAIALVTLHVYSRALLSSSGWQTMLIGFVVGSLAAYLSRRAENNAFRTARATGLYVIILWSLPYAFLLALFGGSGAVRMLSFMSATVAVMALSACVTAVGVTAVSRLLTGWTYRSGVRV